ncbi:50S ribosomal protein L29 [Patescibacteria group bacterium]|nr:50S ribosomal protein L29 [Patescibacteria group bacterium]MBU4142691.1 50S ribosomal protein L29 [Patescibacteria group bacterium]
MKAKELRQKTKEELTRTLKENREKLRSLRFDLADKKLKKTDAIGKVRREIARILTILNIEANKRK